MKAQHFLCVWLILTGIFLVKITESTVEEEGDSFQRSTGQALNLLHAPRLEQDGDVVRLSPHGWNFDGGFQGMVLPQANVTAFNQNFRGEFSLRITGILANTTHTQFLSITKPGKALPYLEITLDLPGNSILLRYLGTRSFQRALLKDVFPSGGQWSDLQVTVRDKQLEAVVDCQPESRRSLHLRQTIGVLPSGAILMFGTRTTEQEGLQGMMLTAMLYNQIDVPTNCAKPYDHEVSDEPPKDATDSLSITTNEVLSVQKRLYSLEKKLSQLLSVIETLTNENINLKSRVESLETCQCVPSCSFNGTAFNEGDIWQPEECIQCQCRNSKSVCSRRLDNPLCAEPCLSNPCVNNGRCINPETDATNSNYQCECQSPYSGNNCQLRQNPCVWPVETGSCNQKMLRYFYDKLSQQCLPFMFSGCGGNVNNYLNLEECVSVALTGACCYRTYSNKIEDATRSTQELEIQCQELHIVECKALHHQANDNETETEVISFNSGLTCEEATCQTAEMCVVGQRSYKEGDVIKLGCQTCVCKSFGQISCECQQISVRKEIRDMSRQELMRFQKAVEKLRSSEDRIWEQFRDLYMYHVMHATGGQFFLPWHRTFLRQLEQRLQEIDCDIVLPYVDFTTDIGFFEDAVIWHSVYYGENGDGGCIENHPFGPVNVWQPCIIRNFNRSIQLPSMMELMAALATDDYEEMSSSLETYVAYVHNFIGGDMMTSSSPYDPIFYAIHTYIDMLYWTWQQRGENKFKFPPVYGNIPMIPFNIPPWAVFDSEADVCVTYALPSKGHPCNETDIVLRRQDQRKRRGDQIPGGQDNGNNSVTGYRMTFYAINNAYNRDGYDIDGFDIGGFDRYGFNSDGYDRYGYNVNGVDRHGNADSSGRFDSSGYDMECFNREGLNRDGLDQYGFFKSGVDIDNCNFYFNGPFATLHSYHIYSVMVKQSQAFLLDVARTCTPLRPLPSHWLSLNWVTSTRDVSGLASVQLPDVQTAASSRFCFDTRPYLNSCQCDRDIAQCSANPCANVTCKAFPEAQCLITFCGRCDAQWYYKGKGVDCQTDRDYCDPNPCHNGGSCQKSIWPWKPQHVTCNCPPGYDGDLCQYPVLDPCSLPLRTGSCDKRNEKWYFNLQSGHCEKFVYLGCGGNDNSFQSLQDCQNKCIKGACCSRQPAFKNQDIGFDSQGYDKYGFNIEGFNRFGDTRNFDNSFYLGRNYFDENGYDWQGFDQDGFGGEDKLNRAGYDSNGYDLEGFNITGYNLEGDFDGIIEYNEDGFDAEGYNRAGLSCQGSDRQGFDVHGVSGEYKYVCEVLTRGKCQEQAREGIDVIKFSPGKTCQEAECGEPCQCRHGNKTYSIYQKFSLGCQTCTCTEKGVISCDCDFAIHRKEIREMSKYEKERYQNAVRQLLQDTGYPSDWYSFAITHAIHKPQATGSALFLPWNRHFLRHVEQALQEIDCGISIPYYDWTVDAGHPHKSLIWAANMLGGNGGDNECVRYHPFKSHHPLYLSPCLRRNFNYSVNLPSAINIEMALRESSYDRFRIQIEMFAHLYQSFVGGHMSSDLAPYDPLFHSVMAFVDKLWTDWQDRHPKGLLTFPLAQRFSRLSPFKMMPDDLFDSRIQLCVDYIPLLEGAGCNKTEHRSLGFNPQGYDRNGYNREGFDKDGYNIQGVDASGNADDREIYNIHGFDKEGFSRSGFDMSGMDRFGFFTDSYNLDGLDAMGYDRSGYNRFGFNKQGFTPYGYNINGTYKQNVDIREIDLFDSFGYNKYGYDQQGFNRNGYDIFGFNDRGYDERVCNKYYLGPIHIIVRAYVSRTLKHLNISVIQNIGRICQQLTPLTPNLIKHYWLNRGRQRSLIRDIYQIQVQNHRIDQTYIPRETSVTTDLIWLPFAPDERMCFETEFFTNCKLGESHILCPINLCEGKVCPDHPTAICRQKSCGQCKREWYDGLTGALLQCSGCVDQSGQMRRERELWTDGFCSECQCLNGDIECETKECPPINCQYPVMLTDQCCPSCDGCDFNGQVVISGSDFRRDGDPCSRCRCMNGNVHCSYIDCPDLRDCQSRVKPEGQCCDICFDCGDRVHGDIWKPNPCQSCECQTGQVSCTEILCKTPDCLHPYTRPGSCCPECSACLHRGILREDRESFSPSPCERCTCTNGTVRCDDVICGQAECNNAITLPGECCPVCGLDCEYEDDRYMDQAVFRPTYNPCLNCTCSNSIVRCQRASCPFLNLPCDTPIRKPGECCPSSCPVCQDQGNEYEEGETWPSANSPCLICECINSAVLCRPRLECTSQCSHGLVRPGECCPRCKECLFEGKVFQDGEKYVIPGDICRRCFCQQGSMKCDNFYTSRECPRLSCQRKEQKEGNCCPVCAGCLYEGNKFQHDDIVSSDRCSQCTCVEGEVICERTVKDCPPVQCSNPIQLPGQCCPKCEDCLFLGQDYRNGQNFSSPRDPCQQCLCKSGQVECKTVSRSCPEVLCLHPGRRKNQCCPQCDKCFYKRRTFRNGQRFIGNSPCEICYCQKGSVSCSSMKCPSVECSNPIVKPGRCCPSCDGICVYQGREYKEGQTFAKQGSKCSTCICQDSKVRCNGEICEPITCNHPATLPGDCCPTCNFCSYERRIFRNQQRFMHPRDTCKQCSCQFGSVTCTDLLCETLNCANPVSMPGSCCPVCPKQCSHGGYFYDDGETFVNSQNKCEDCLCRQGRSRCKARMCPRVTCENPVSDGCCQVCSDCQFGDLVLTNGEIQENPNDPCQVCECSSGSVQCRSVQCPDITCTNPVIIGCCPVCRDCDYRGRRYENGALMKEADRCQTCYCQDGNVQCQSSPCPIVTCDHPSRGQCCEECTNCYYQGRNYQDGQRFADPDRDSCQECICSAGDVLCSPTICPAITCTHPAQSQCCQQCQDCSFNGQTVKDGSAVENPESACEECRCLKGSISCRPKQCRDKQLCRHPVIRDCCPQCSDCSYKGRDYRNGEQFRDPSSQCSVCRCSNGEVLCRQRQCPPVACLNPVQGECCLECSRCSYDGQTYLDGQTFLNVSDKCQECECHTGNVLCSRILCAAATRCSHPIQLEDDCCPMCGRGCLYNDRILLDGEMLQDNCQECTCDRGSMICLPQSCPDVDCTHPKRDGCCHRCTDCFQAGALYRNGEVFQDQRDRCSQCTCRDGSITCRKHACPAPSCSHPTRGQCCQECIDCQFNGQRLTNGQRVVDVSKRCSECLCEYGSVRCSRKPCSNVPCRNPSKDECGCPTCLGCSYNGYTVQSGETFPRSEDECQECVCQAGTIECHNKRCTKGCSHPARVSGCCPQCTDCLFQGKIVREGKTAISSKNPCRKCECQQGSVVCQSVKCPDVPCLNPVKMDGECCPSCPLCVYFGQTYRDNQDFQHPEDLCQVCSCKMGRVKCKSERCAVTCSHPRKDQCCPQCDDCFFEDILYKNGLTFEPDACRSCTCKDGNVNCDELTCPNLPCARKKKVEGQCCDVCQGCTFQGILYDEDASWVLPDSPCVTCVCNSGLVTCMETDCFVPCSNPITQPGQCCPVCPTCNYDGLMYADGQDFTPNGDPCDKCRCDNGNLRCLHNTCPSLVNCPLENLRDPQPGTCCPTCASALSSGCSLAERGQIRRPRENDPCLFCECKEDFMWVCMKEKCPRLACPPDDQIFTKGKCCPTCPACFDTSNAKFYLEGAEWSAVNDPCVTCVCQNGDVKCTMKECQPISCQSSEQLVTLKGQCCESCQPVANATCFYENLIRQPGESWAIDGCTRCQCIGGKVTCNVKQCPYLDCGKDQAPTNIPGQCCPVCQKRPGTCLVFGDPHYKTFDGATLHFQGTCKYIMAADCENDLFRVEIQHDSRGSSRQVSWAQNFTITVAGLNIDLMQKNLVKVNGQLVELPYLNKPHVLIESSGKSIVLSTQIGLRVLWDGSSYGQVTVPGSFKRKMCGICGNFNGFPQDDLRTRSGLVTNSPATFGNSWKSNTQSDETCQDADDVNPCVTAGYRVRKLATSKCTILKSQKFSRCHRVVSPEPFFSSCVYDMCVCMEEPDCLCQIVSAYAHECARMGVKVDWRSSSLCAYDCDASKGLVFDECGPVCPRTCETHQGNTNSGTGATSNCFKPCVASCQCTADKVLHNGRCISPTECPHIERHPIVE